MQPTFLTKRFFFEDFTKKLQLGQFWKRDMFSFFQINTNTSCKIVCLRLLSTHFSHVLYSFKICSLLASPQLNQAHSTMKWDPIMTSVEPLLNLSMAQRMKIEIDNILPVWKLLHGLINIRCLPIATEDHLLCLKLIPSMRACMSLCHWCSLVPQIILVNV